MKLTFEHPNECAKLAEPVGRHAFASPWKENQYKHKQIYHDVKSSSVSKQAPTSKSRYDPSRVGLATSFSAKLFLWLSGERTGLSSKSSILQDLATTAKKYQLGPPVTTAVLQSPNSKFQLAFALRVFSTSTFFLKHYEYFQTVSSFNNNNNWSY